MERSRLADLMSNIQKMHNDLERSGENDRRRLEGQLQMLENQRLAGDPPNSWPCLINQQSGLPVTAASRKRISPTNFSAKGH